MKCIFLLLSLITSVAFSQGVSPDEKVFDYPSFRECGLVTRWSSVAIPPNCLTIAKNVYFDEDLSVSRRKGGELYNTTPCTDTKSIRGLWNFDAIDGQRYIVIFSSQSFFYTKGQRDCIAISGLNDFSSVSEFECVQGLGAFYCQNGVNTPFYWTGTSTGSWGYNNTTNSYLLATKVGSFRNRIVIGDVSGQPSRILMSGEGDGTDWTLKIPGVSTSPASLDISGLEDGNSITALMGQYQNAYYVGRDGDLWGISGNDRRDFKLRQISSQIGVIDSRSVKEKNGSLFWLSRRGIEKMTGTTIERASDAVRDIVDGIISSSSNKRIKNYNSQSDWEAGLYSVDRLSTSIYPGSVVPSTWSHTESTSADWSTGTIVQIDTVTAPGLIGLNNTTSYSIVDAFTDGNFSAAPVWTASGDNFFSASGYNLVYSTVGKSLPTGTTSYTGYLYTPSTNTLVGKYFLDMSAGAQQLTFPVGAGNSWFNRTTFSRFTFASDSVSVSTYNGLAFQIKSVQTSEAVVTFTSSIQNCVLGVCTDLVSSSKGVDNDNPIHGPYLHVSSMVCTNLVINVATGSVWTTGTGVTWYSGNNGTGHMDSDEMCSLAYTGLEVPTDNTILNKELVITQGSVYVSHGWSTFTIVGNDPMIDNIQTSYGGYVSSGTWTSHIFDTTFSTPIGGPFYFSDYAPIGSTIVYSVRQSTFNSEDGMGAWTVISTTTSGIFRVPFTNRYWQSKIALSTEYSTQTPTVGMIGLEATTSGYYYGDCVNMTGANSLGNFRPSTNLTGGSSIDFWISTGTTCNQVTRSTANWIAQTANAPINTSTSSFLGFRVYENLVTTTDTVRLDALTFDWDEGASRPILASAVYRERYYVFYTTSTASGAVNDSVLVLDMNDKWSQLDNINAYSAIVHDSVLYTGESRSSGTLVIQDTGMDDTGKAFQFKIKTNDFDFGNPSEIKKLKRIYLTLKSETTPGQNIDLTLKYYIDGSTTPYSLSTVGLDEAKEVGYFVAKFPAINSTPSSFHWLSLSLEYEGKQGPISLHGIKVIYSPIRFE